MFRSVAKGQGHHEGNHLSMLTPFLSDALWREAVNQMLWQDDELVLWRRQEEILRALSKSKRRASLSGQKANGLGVGEHEAIHHLPRR